MNSPLFLWNKGFRSIPFSWYTNAMKNTFFGCCLLSLSLLCACSKELASSLEEDKVRMQKQGDFSFDSSICFSQSFQTMEKDGFYRFSYTLDKACQDYHHVRLLLSPKKDQFFPFGYEADYTLVKDKEKADKANNIIYGININFSSTIEIDSLYAYFSSDEETFYFIVTK